MESVIVIVQALCVAGTGTGREGGCCCLRQAQRVGFCFRPCPLPRYLPRPGRGCQYLWYSEALWLGRPPLACATQARDSGIEAKLPGPGKTPRSCHPSALVTGAVPQLGDSHRGLLENCVWGADIHQPSCGAAEGGPPPPGRTVSAHVGHWTQGNTSRLRVSYGLWVLVTNGYLGIQEHPPTFHCRAAAWRLPVF